jgi:hypothetical protein
MTQRTVPLTPEQFGRITQLENSIQYWSNEYTLQQLRAKSVLANIDGLYQARRQIIAQAYKEAGVDPTKVREERLSKDGMECVYEDQQGQQVSEPVPVIPSNGDPTSPAGVTPPSTS